MKVKQIHKNIGVSIEGIDLSKIDENTFKKIKDLWVQYLIIIFPKQNISDEDHIKFGKKFISIPKTINPIEVDFEKAKKIIDDKLKSEAPIHIYKNEPVTKGIGRFGPFLKWNNAFFNVGKNYDFNNLDKNEIEVIIKDKIRKDQEKVINNWTEDGIRIEKGRWGKFFIIKGKLKIQISKEKDPSKLSLNEVKDIIQLNSKKKIKSK